MPIKETANSEELVKVKYSEVLFSMCLENRHNPPSKNLALHCPSGSTSRNLLKENNGQAQRYR